MFIYPMLFKNFNRITQFDEIVYNLNVINYNAKK